MTELDAEILAIRQARLANINPIMDELRVRRKMLRLTQIDVQNRIGISACRLSLLENAQLEPTADELKRLRNLLYG